MNRVCSLEDKLGPTLRQALRLLDIQEFDMILRSESKSWLLLFTSSISVILFNSSKGTPAHHTEGV
jgi:hypothetical protein